MYSPTKFDLKILSYIYKHQNKGVSRSDLLKRYKQHPERIDLLCNLHYINHNCELERNDNGFIVGSIPDSALYYIEDIGICEVESHQWFDSQYVITSLVIPIIVGIVSSLITAFLLA